MAVILNFPTKHPEFCTHEELLTQFRTAVVKVRSNPQMVKNFRHIWKAVYQRAQTETLKTIAKDFMMKAGE